MDWAVTALVAASLAPPPAAAGIRFREVAEAWNLSFRHHHCGSGQFYMPETMGSGVVIFDYDGDGDPDVLFVDSGPLPGCRGISPRSRLLRNDGGARFVDVTARAGIEVRAYGMGGTAGDIEGDGDLDLYVTAFGSNQLFVNRGDGTFADGTARAGVGDERWSASAAFGDVDRDGDLDLYVTNYVDFSFDDNPPCGQPERGLRSYCHPEVYDGLPDRFYRNRGDGTFEDATAAAGLAEEGGKGLGVLISDLVRDGWPDIYVANDMTANFLFRNLGGGAFEESALLAGVAYSDLGVPEAGMGIAAGDLDRNGQIDLLITHLDFQTNAVYLNVGAGVFTDGRYRTGLAEPSIYKVGFGTVAADLDQDADLDVAVANGHIVHNVDLQGTGTSYKQENQVFENLGTRFRQVAGSGLTAVRASRGLAAGDLDGDGDLDLAISNSNDLSEVYENVSEPAGGWVKVDLVGSGSNREGIGALVILATAEGTQLRESRTASSYLSQDDLTLHFGVGGATRLESLEVAWPSGRRQRWRDLPARHRLRLFERSQPFTVRPASPGAFAP